MAFFVFNLKSLFLLIAEALNDLLGNASIGEAAIVEEVLHGDVLGEVREHADAVVGAGNGASVAKWRHLLREVDEFGKAFDALASGSDGWRLRNGIDAYFLFDSVVIAKRACD